MMLRHIVIIHLLRLGKLYVWLMKQSLLNLGLLWAVVNRRVLICVILRFIDGFFYRLRSSVLLSEIFVWCFWPSRFWISQMMVPFLLKRFLEYFRFFLCFYLLLIIIWSLSFCRYCTLTIYFYFLHFILLSILFFSCFYWRKRDWILSSFFWWSFKIYLFYLFIFSFILIQMTPILFQLL